MFKIITIFLIALHLSVSQMTGFWWLNSNFTALSGLKTPAVAFEEIDEFATDESDKIVFDNEDNAQTVSVDVINSAAKIKNGDSFDFSFPNFKLSNKSKVNITDISTTVDNSIQVNNNSRYKDFRISKSSKFDSNETAPKTKEETIYFPSERDERKEVFNYFSKYSNKENSFKHKTIKESDVENNICSYISKDNCLLNNGIVQNEQANRLKESVVSKDDFVCCVIPIKNNIRLETRATGRSKFRFPRSTNRGQIQRERLLKKVLNVRRTATTVNKKIVSDYDYVDPYWNIKGSNVKAPVKSTKRPGNPYASYDDVYYDTVESDEEYASELPKPGLLGVYSGATRRPSQTYSGYGGGYFSTHSTLDPRLDDRASVLSVKTKPLVTSSEEIFDAQSHIVTYQANPDFQVLQDFKLLNLIRNKSRVHDRNSRKTTTEKVLDYDSYESKKPTKASYGASSEVIYDDVDDDQTNEKCGQRSLDYDESKENGDSGTHPWIALVVHSKRQHNLLCSATIIHPRAAITAASCVNGATLGEVVVRAGEWDLTETSNSQQRVASLHIHPLFETGTLNHDLALLYWRRPLQITSAVQPACLRDVEIGEKCSFVGWSGPDQTIRARPRVQRASVIKRRTCMDQLNSAGFLKNMPSGAFCASVETGGCVSGLGGSLLCQRNGHTSAVGVTVWRKRCDKSPIILLPVHKWAKQALAKIGIL